MYGFLDQHDLVVKSDLAVAPWQMFHGVFSFLLQRPSWRCSASVFSAGDK
jgi:hypothetical protein